MAGDSPAAVVVDAEGNQVDVLDRGDAVHVLRASDSAQLELLGKILHELKKLNLFMELMTDEQIGSSDVGE